MDRQMVWFVGSVHCPSLIWRPRFAFVDLESRFAGVWPTRICAFTGESNSTTCAHQIGNKNPDLRWADFSDLL
jgi:hypothetical protein